MILILDFNILPYDEHINKTVTVLKDHKNHEINNYQEYYYIELPKFRKKRLNKEDKVSQWLTFIDSENKERMEEVMKENTLVKRANEEYEYLVGEEEERRLEWLRLKYHLEYNSAKRAGVEEGEQIGIKKGKIEERVNIAKTMLKKGMDIDTIAEVTYLSKADIKNLK